MSEFLININALMGHVKLVSVEKQLGDKTYLGGYSISYDRDGKEMSRTEPRFNCVVFMDKPLLASWAGWKQFLWGKR